MKKLFNVLILGAICTFGFFSCTEKEIVDLDVPEVLDPEAPINVSYETIKPTSFFNVPVKEGLITVVMQGDELLGYTSEETTIEVLNTTGSSFTRSKNKGLNCVYVTPEQLATILPDNGSWNEADASSGWTMYKTIMFEDLVSKSDYDYNDLIIHVQQMKKGNALRLYIHPIAMGNYDELSLGADIFLIDEYGLGNKCASVLFSNDVRADLFPGKPTKTFINTDFEDTYTDNNVLDQLPTYFVPAVSITEQTDGFKVGGKENHWFEVDQNSMKGKTFGINWFIINNEKDPDKKLYAVPAIMDNIRWRDGTGRPYGIISADTRLTQWPLSDGDTAGHDWINYPMEKVHINEVYIDFDKWLAGTGNADWDNPNITKSINAIGYSKPVGGIPGQLSGNKALYDINGCFEAYPEYIGKNIWNNGNPDETTFPVARK